MKTSHSIITLITLVGITIILNSCNRIFGIKGRGDIVEKELSIENFNGVDLQSAFNIEIVKGDEQSVFAKGHENIIERLQTDVKNGVWEADLKNGNYRDYQLTIYITSPKIDKLYLSGSGNITSQGFDNLTDFTATISGSGNITGNSTFTASDQVTTKISGSGNIDLDVNGSNHSSTISGSGNITLSGYVNAQTIKISGSGNINTFGLNCETAEVNIPGSGDVEVYVNQTLDVNISGSGNVYYKGSPTITQNISGSGSIIKKD